MRDETDDVLDEIPTPTVPITPTREAESERDDLRRHPVVQAILISIGAIGLLITGASISIHNGDAEGAVVAAEDFTSGLGIELLASSAMLWFFYQVLNGASDTVKVRWLFVVAAIGSLTCIVPLILFSSGFYSGVFISAGIEIIGAVVIFAVLDNVLEALQIERDGRK